MNRLFRLSLCLLLASCSAEIPTVEEKPGAGRADLIVQNATMQNQKILTSTLEKILKEINNDKQMTPAIIIIGEVVRNYTKFQNCLEYIPSSMVPPIDNLGFDIWKNGAVTA